MALGIICILLIAGLGGTIAYYSLAIGDKDNAISSKNNQIASLDSQIADRNNTISSMNVQISELKSNITNLQNQVNSDNSTISNLTYQVNELTFMLTHNSSILFSNQTVDISDGHWGIGVLWNYTFSEAGYVGVQVSGSFHTYVNFEELKSPDYPNYSMDVGTGSLGVFPVSAMTSLNIFVGTRDDSFPTVAITVTYYY